MADGKWIDGLDATTDLVAAARRVLAVRFARVRDHLPAVVAPADDDPEHVHQLRVATRRADAALRTFRSCLPDRTFKDARRRLRRLRRAAGAARDWDVFGEELAARMTDAAARDVAGLEYLAGYAQGQRDAAGPGLVAAVEDHQRDFDARLEELLDAAASPGEGARLLNLARPELARLQAELERAAAADLDDYANLHQVRIAGKRLRYAMEPFAGCFPAAFRDEAYPRIEELQEILGRANDSHVANERLTALRDRLKRTAPALWKRARAGMEGLLRFHQRRLPRERKQFAAWWDRWQEDGKAALLVFT